jgi:hypothetical protein
MKLLEVTDIFNTLIVVMVSWMCTYMETFQILSLKYVQLLISIMPRGEG